MPKRIQRMRTNGWKMPEGSIYVGRPTAWGNPFVVGEDGTAAECVEKYRVYINLWLEKGYINMCDIETLRGKNLACWCSLDKPCHADVLLELANAPKKDAHD